MSSHSVRQTRHPNCILVKGKHVERNTRRKKFSKAKNGKRPVPPRKRCVRHHKTRAKEIQKYQLTPLEPQSCFGDELLKFQVVCPQKGTAVLTKEHASLRATKKHEKPPPGNRTSLWYEWNRQVGVAYQWSV